ncbi:MAG: CDP-diacylglycerol--serine O-phosphatidyltransferase [Bacteroidales bacterium]|nr:CDP-diacylglycerol--serine O-phosphatidyltransferase [Bacteroidales bacterium]
MISIKKHIPNSITCLNLLCGCIACMFAFKGYTNINYVYLSAILICAAAVFDFMDGFAARLLKAYSPMGKELDSLADLISFGFAPGVISMQIANLIIPPYYTEWWWEYMPYMAFLIPVFAGLRLAKFNIDTRQTTSFIGLPVPANALFWIGFYSLVEQNSWAECIYCWIAMVLLFSYLMVSEIPMFSLKFANLKFKENYLRFILIISTILFVAFLGYAGLAPSILFYIILSFVQNLLLKKESAK